jgi:hypothetical protein
MVPPCLDKSPHQINNLWADFSKQMGTICLGQITSLCHHGDALPRSRVLFALAAFLVLGSAGLAGLGASSPAPAIHSMGLGDHEIAVEIAATDQERMRGLSGRKDLAAGNGLLFVFPGSALHGIWMKDMNFAIDIMWISQDLRVVTIAENVAPESFPAVYRPAAPARYVLELKAGSARVLGIAAGTTVTLPAGLAP